MNSSRCINIYSEDAQTQFHKLGEVFTCPWVLQQEPRVKGGFGGKHSILGAGLADSMSS